MVNVRLASAALLLPMALMVSCGSEQPQFVKKFHYDIKDNVAKVGLEFSEQISVNTDITIPILNYGAITFIAASPENGFQIETSLNFDALVDPEILSLDRTRKLPNGQNLSSYVVDDLAQLDLTFNEKVGSSLYLGLDPNQFYIGVAVELAFLNEKFPTDLVLTQRIRDTGKNREFGVISVFGPKVVDGKLEAHGGLMFITNVSQLLRYRNEDRAAVATQSLAFGAEEQEGLGINLLAPDNETLINLEEYRDPKALFGLYRKFNKEGRKMGMID